jgi:hypothetical protein
MIGYLISWGLSSKKCKGQKVIRGRSGAKRPTFAEIKDDELHRIEKAVWVSLKKAVGYCENKSAPDDRGIIALSELRRFTGMVSTWQTETGHLVCRWSDVGQRLQYNPSWMQEVSDIHIGYSPPPPDFAARSPFGGATWFQPHPVERDC